LEGVLTRDFSKELKKAILKQKPPVGASNIHSFFDLGKNLRKGWNILESMPFGKSSCSSASVEVFTFLRRRTLP
jgi:hypothetical protein